MTGPVPLRRFHDLAGFQVFGGNLDVLYGAVFDDFHGLKVGQKAPRGDAGGF